MNPKDLRNSSNPYAAPSVATVAAQPQAQSQTEMSFVAKFVLCCLLPIALSAVALIGLTVIQTRAGTLLLLACGVVLFLAAVFYGWRHPIRSLAVPMILANFAAWVAFVWTIRALNSLGGSPVNVARSDVRYFIGISVVTAFAMVVVAAISGLVRTSSPR